MVAVQHETLAATFADGGADRSGVTLPRFFSLARTLEEIAGRME